MTEERLLVLRSGFMGHSRIPAGRDLLLPEPEMLPGDDDPRGWPRATRGPSAEPSRTRTDGLDMSIEHIDAKNAKEVQGDPTVVAYAPVMPLSLIAPVNSSALALGTADPLAGARKDGITWGVRAVGGDNTRFTGDGVTVAILDTGIDSSHEAFARPGLQIISQDFTGTGIEDTNGHGTHCAATVFGGDVQGTRIGIAPGVRRALIAKVIAPGAQTDALIEALQWALRQGAHVISMSLGFDFVGYRERLFQSGLPEQAATSRALQAFRDNIRLFDRMMSLVAAHEAFGRSSLIIAASGNESGRDAPAPYVVSKSSPAAAEGVISVGALAQSAQGLKVAAFSNTDPTVVAPGVGIVSARAGGGLASMNGTSMACPHAAGVAALICDRLLEEGSGLSASRITSLLTTSATRKPLASDMTPSDVGEGLVQAPRT